MADNWWPKTGATIIETRLRDWVAGLMAAAGDFVLSGLTVPASDVDLTLTVATGVAYIDGYRIEADAENITLGASNTHYIYLQYSVDGSDNITGHALTSNTTGITPSRAILLATAVTSGTAVTSTTDRRRIGFAVMKIYHPQAVTTANAAANTVAVTNIINVNEEGEIWNIQLENNGLAGTSGAVSVVIQLDGGTARTITLGTWASTVMQMTAEAGEFGFKQDLSGFVTGSGAAQYFGRIYFDRKLSYSTSCKIDLSVTAQVGMSGNWKGSVSRGKVTN